MPDSAVPEVSFRTVPRTVVASIEHKGAYAGVGDAMRRLKAWTESKGIEPAGSPFCMFYDNPLETPEAELRSEACIPVSTPFEGENQFTMKTLEETEAAETRHGGAPEEFYMTYGPFLEGLLKGGYQLLGPAREYFRDASDVNGPGSGYLIQQPVRKRQAKQV